MTPKTKSRLPAMLIIAGISAGCWAPSPREVVVYSALDREFSEPVLNDFQQQTGLVVRAQYDVESTKTVGLVRRIIQEQNRPVCDVFWNNEILHTLRLKKLGLLSEYRAANADDFPASYRSPTGHWYGLAARARVLLVNRQLVPQAEQPDSIEDLADPKWRDRVGIAKPLFGTTATHAAVLFSKLGEASAQEFFRNLKGQARILSGNKQVATAVGRGQLAFGLTDTDDAIIEVEQGQPVDIIFPDQDEAGLGALFIPNTVAIIRGGPHERERTAISRLPAFPRRGTETGRRTERTDSAEPRRYEGSTRSARQTDSVDGRGLRGRGRRLGKCRSVPTRPVRLGRVKRSELQDIPRATRASRFHRGRCRSRS